MNDDALLATIGETRQHAQQLRAATRRLRDETRELGATLQPSATLLRELAERDLRLSEIERKLGVVLAWVSAIAADDVASAARRAMGQAG